MIILASQYDAQIVPSRLLSLFPGDAESVIFSGKNFYIFGIPAALIAGIVFLWCALLSAVMILSGYISSMLALVLSSLSCILFGACIPYAVMRVISFDFHQIHFVFYSAVFVAAAASGVLLRSEKRRDSKFFEEAAKSLLSFKEPRGRFIVMMVVFLAVMSGAVVSVINTSFELYGDKERLSLRNNTLVAGEFAKQKKEYSSLPETPVFTGNKNAKIKIAVFTDPFCPACVSFYRTERVLLKKFGKDVAFYHYMYPLSGECNPSIKGGSNKWSCAVSKKVYAAALIGRLESFLCSQSEKPEAVRKLIEKNKPRAEIYREYFGDDKGFTEFDKIEESSKARERLKLDIAFADRIGITKTPTIFINGKRLNSSAREDLMNYIIEDELRNSNSR